MKRIVLVAALIGMVAVTSCGSSSGGGGSTAQQAINSGISAFDGLANNVFNNFDQVCTAKAEWDCSAACSNTGGVLDLDDTTDTATMNNCQSSGLTFTGTLTGDDDSSTLDMSQFGECTNVEGTITDTGTTTENCTGTITATCAGQNVTCEMSTDCDTCTITATAAETAGTTPQQAVDTSGDAFGVVNEELAECQTNPCNCSGGGTVDVGADDLTFNACVVNGETFNGTITQTGPDTVNMNFQTFGQCTGINGTVDGMIADTNCSGQLSGTCAGQAITCNFNADCGGCTI